MQRKSWVVALLAASLSISACGAGLTATPSPTLVPTQAPTLVPTATPTEAPILEPTATPTPVPTAAPTPLPFVIRPGIWSSAITVTLAGTVQVVTLALTVQLDSTALCWNVIKGSSVVDIGSCPSIIGGHFEGTGVFGWAIAGDFASATAAAGTYTVKSGSSTVSGNWQGSWAIAGP